MLTPQNSSRHATLVEAAVRNPAAAAEVGHLVRHSWARCLDSYALDPRQSKQALIVERAELQTRREQLGMLLPIARIELLGLRRRLQQSDVGIVLTDRDGVILHYVGEPGFATTARRSGLREGAVWSERELGTNGIGTCIVEERALVVHQFDHFLAQNVGLTCSAAPIFDRQGRVVAALDISGMYRQAQTHTLALVEIAAQNIENRVLLQACKLHFVLRFHRQAEFISTPGEGILAFDANGSVVGANRSALELIGARDHAQICGQGLETVFDTSLAQQVQAAARGAYHPAPLILRGSGHRLWTVIQPPFGGVPGASRVTPGTARGEPLAPDAGRADAPPGDARRSEAPPADGGPLVQMEFGDPAMMDNLRVVRRVLDRDIPILLLGETGTGKGRFAKAIHAASSRRDKPFVTVNCAAIPETLVESELFGYKAGAFTGATRDGNPGRVLLANGGTLFLDEIGDMPLALQLRLLSLIEDREVMPLGGSMATPVDLRIISATNCDLLQRVAAKQFREDLYYRLNGLALRMPPLRERRDIEGLVRRLLDEEVQGRGSIAIEPALLRRLAGFRWPGNLRQLRNLLRTMLAMTEGKVLRLADFDPKLIEGSPIAPSDAASAAGEDVLGAAESSALRSLLDSVRWNVSAAAARLHISRRTLYRKMTRHGIARDAPAAHESDRNPL